MKMLFSLAVLLLFASLTFADERPNILFILADDLRWDTLGFMGDPVIRTPHLDALAAGGAVFQNAFVTTSICAVSRASILTGQYARRHGVHDFGTPLPSISRTYPGILRAHGYVTGFIGKWGIDEGVGALLAELRQQGVADNTVILFTSDHGHMQGEHGFFGKCGRNTAGCELSWGRTIPGPAEQSCGKTPAAVQRILGGGERAQGADRGSQFLPLCQRRVELGGVGFYKRDVFRPSRTGLAGVNSTD